MLKINPAPLFDSDVEITVPGQEEPGTISLTFKYKNKEDLVSFWEENKDKNDAEVFIEFVDGWNGIDAKFNVENVETFLRNYPAAAREITVKYQRLLLESRIKN